MFHSPLDNWIFALVYLDYKKILHIQVFLKQVEWAKSDGGVVGGFRSIKGNF